MSSLEKIIENLKAKREVDAVFLTGSQGSEHKPCSDIDLVIILNENKEKIASLYTWIDSKFADIFFFDLSDLKRLEETSEITANTIDGSFIDWLAKADIRFDKSGALTRFNSRIGEIKLKMKIPLSRKDLVLQGINYNFIANSRYYDSHDPAYHEALEIRLPYSFVELITGYFELRDIPWRGEKNALKFLKANNAPFHEAFRLYAKAVSLEERFDAYKKMVVLVLPLGYALWSTDEIAPQPKDRENFDRPALVRFWKELIS